MRMMMRFSIPVERGNEAIEDGSLGQTIEAIVSETKAEAAYFLLEGGERAGYIFFELEDAAFLPKLNQIMFAALDAAIDVTPALTLDDLKRGLSSYRLAATLKRLGQVVGAGGVRWSGHLACTVA